MTQIKMRGMKCQELRVQQGSLRNYKEEKGTVSENKGNSKCWLKKAFSKTWGEKTAGPEDSM